MFSRRREYYIGGRPRRRSGRVTIVALALALVAVVGAVALAGNLPALGLAPGSSAAAVATPGPVGAASPQPPPASLPAGSLPPIAPPPSGSPTPSGPPPCEGPAGIEPARVVSHGSIHEKTVALTFDDGTNPENTAQILRILKQFKVNATFFPTGRSMERFPKVWRAVARANYPIANHTYAHGELSGKCFDVQRRELSRAAAVFDEQHLLQFPAMRPPYELFDDTTAVAAAAEGLQAVILWNIDTRDWQGASAASIRREALHGGRGSIILMHTGPEATAEALPGIIRGFKARGFRFVTIGEMLGIDGPVPFPAPQE
ncbi:MAG TPA: polysaccharide deacetylase family protein [Candidatus Limnocylindrales bacterium]|nr:polysaccharide deacetylase family protein [Candidatus Limnocylindrales bacterium]